MKGRYGINNLGRDLGRSAAGRRRALLYSEGFVIISRSTHTMFLNALVTALAAIHGHISTFLCPVAVCFFVVFAVVRCASRTVGGII